MTAPRTISLGMATPDPIDPVCGMTVSIAHAGGGSLIHDGTTYYFCHESCRRKFRRSPGKYLGGRSFDAMSEANSPTTRYICPMDPEVVSDRPGACPKCGMALEPEAPSLDDAPDPELRSLNWRLKLGLLIGVPLIALAMFDMFAPGMPISHLVGHTTFMVLQAVLCTPIVFVCGWPFLQRFAVSLRTVQFNMFTLIGLGVLAAYGFSLFGLANHLLGLLPGVMVMPFFESAAGIVVLVLVGQVMELRARGQTGDAIRKLLKLTPKIAHVVLENGKEADLALDLIDAGDRVRVRPGEQFPVDGVIQEGSTTADESMLTGEPMPVEKLVAAKVLAGTINGHGSVVVTCEKVGTATVLSQVIALVGQAQRTRLPIQQTVDRVAAWFVPAVTGIAIVTFILWMIFGNVETRLVNGVLCAVAVLVIACPCALGLATPMAIVVGIGRAASRGVLFRDAVALERLAAVDTIVFDKTGTLTEGKPKVTAIVPSNPNPGEDENTVLRWATALERSSEHPLARAIVNAAEAKGVVIPVATDVQTVPGLGVRGVVEGRAVLVGNDAFFVQNDVPATSHPDWKSPSAETVIGVAVNQRLVGFIKLGDRSRPEAQSLIAKLTASGVRSVMLTGDSRAVAERIAKEVGISEVFADQLPADKHRVITQLKAEGRIVAMCGDGINDAPALAVADVGIAMGTGTDVAITTAGVTLVKSDLRSILTARELSLVTVRTIRQNLALAFVYNALAIPIAAGVLIPFGGSLLDPIWAAAAMSLSSVSVIANSLRRR